MFRLRIGGYKDIFIDLFRREAPDQTERERVGAHGVLLDSTRANRERPEGAEIWEKNDGSKIKYDSVYSLAKPLRCSIYSNGELYLLDEIEKLKEQLKKENRTKSRERSAIKRRKKPASASNSVSA